MQNYSESSIQRHKIFVPLRDLIREVIINAGIPARSLKQIKTMNYRQYNTIIIDRYEFEHIGP